MSAARPSRVSLRQTITLRMGALVTGTALALLVSYAMLGVRPVVEHIAESRFSLGAAQVSARLNALVAPTEQLLSIARGWVGHTVSPLDDPERLNQYFKPVLSATPHIAAVIAGGADGRGWLLLRRADGSWHYRLTDVPNWDYTHQTVDQAPDGSAVSNNRRAFDYDPRNRIWYQAAARDRDGDRIHWTSPYTFTYSNQPGITVSTRVRLENAEPFVLGFDVFLDDLSRATASTAVSENSLTLVLTEDERVLALPAAPPGYAPDEWAKRALQPATALGLPPVGDALQHWRAAPQPNAHIVSYRSNGETWLASLRPFQLGEQKLWVMVLAPAADFMPAWGPIIASVLLALAAILGIALLLARRQAISIARPLELLALASSRLSRLDFKLDRPIESPIAEIDQLARRQDDAREMLQRNQTALESQATDLRRQIEALKAAEARLSHVDHHDSLTDLPNRLMLNDRLHHAITLAHRHRTRLALLFIDLDHFKTINDTLSHAVGDRLIYAAANRLRRAVRDSDTLARSGGDEFVVLLEGLDDATEAGRQAARLLDTIAEPFDVDGQRLFVTASIGISLCPDDGLDGATLMRNADAAMYKAKEQGRNTYHFYTEEMTRQALDRLELQGLLRQAVRMDELELHFQPQIALAGGEITGAEALVRWRHPRKGLIPPAHFIALAEESGAIVDIGEWVIKQACRAWQQLRADGQPIEHIAVNVSVVQLRNPAFVEVLQDIVERAGMPNSAIEIELTESVFLETQTALGLLRQLGERGFRLALDDFGTGYSSLSYLRQLPFQKLKIDRTFIADIGGAKEADALVCSIIGLGQAIGLKLTAEGVETEAQARFLARQQCDEVQGYLHTPPLDYAALLAWLTARRSAAAPPSA